MERAGNRVPHPAIIFLALIVIVIVLSAVTAAFDVTVTTEVAVPKDTTVSQDHTDAGSTYPSTTQPDPEA
ncbi:AbgT family transporter [Humibacillus sp. DSM 29435]|uniref:AbgT family transporter n=1 Tax=Humibacillus sp. DSM 29435 TaxID=1869167 RepID=UPI0011131510|nr:AbgT family transporter [Humibacillus sp. DSM 29435]